MLVAVATESGDHAKIGLDCIQRWCANVIIEKPIALSLAKIRARFDCRGGQAKGVKLCACHQNRFNKSIQKIRTAVDEGRFRQNAARRGAYPLEPRERLL